MDCGNLFRLHPVQQPQVPEFLRWSHGEALCSGWRCFPVRGV